MRLGTLRLRERLTDVAERTIRYAGVIEELLNNEMRTYKKLYLKDRKIRYLLLVGSYIQYINRYIHKDSDAFQITKEEFIGEAISVSNLLSGVYILKINNIAIRFVKK